MDKEDFEFQPLTEGLGFYSKVERLHRESQAGVSSAPRSLPQQPESLLDEPVLEGLGPAEKSMQDLLSKFPSSVDFDEPFSEPPKIFQPLPRENTPLRPPKRELLKTPEMENQVPLKKERNREMEESLRKAFPQNQPLVAKAQPTSELEGSPMWRPVPTAITAAAIDLLTVAVLSFFCVLSLMAFANIDLLNLIQDPRTSLLASVQLGVLVLGVSFIYQLATRSLIGQSLGDWTMNVRLGTAQQQSSWTYPLAVLWRHLMIWATGLLVLPLLSLIVRRDVARYLSGVGLYHRKMG